MKKYTNRSQELRSITFKDGDAQFLMRGQSFETAREVASVQDGIRVTEVTVKATESK